LANVEWQGLSKRVHTERTVMIDGFAISKESLSCGQWEAFPTFSTNYVPPPKRKKRQIQHQEFCQSCRDGGDLVLCSGCPRVFHGECAGYTKYEVEKMISFYCPQHNCCVCWRNTSACGGMLFRCRTCPDSYWHDSFCLWANCSEDCLPPQGDIDGIGSSLPEFEVLGYPETKQAYYIRCPDCVVRFTSPRDEIERDWTNSWIEEIQRAEKQLDGETVEEMDDIQTTIEVPSDEKEVSPSMNTTEAKEYTFFEVEKDVHVGREVIVID
jgi:SWI/SNF-related matrix-associated actin-dependent regulator of chromatin subfamily A member 5